MFKQIQLDYAFSALEPHIDALTMETHYSKHHAAYTNNFNALLEKHPDLQNKSAEEIFQNLEAVPADIRQGVRNNGGGFYNHNVYFDLLSPNGGGSPSGVLADKINKDFGSVEALKDEISKSGAARFGSGWAWLIYDKAADKLVVTSTANQDNPLMEGSDNVLIALDVWEHAYYLKYKNLRADYIKAFFEVLDWNKVAARFELAK